MKFEKIIIPPGWQESFTKYPNGRTIFEALTSTITSVNEGIEAVNTKVDQGLLAIDAAANTIRSEVAASFLILQNKLEQDIEYLQDDLVADISVLQSQLAAVDAQLADKVTQSQLAAVDAQLADKVTQSQLAAVDAQLAYKASKTEVGLLSGLLTTAKTSIVNAINELFNSKANKTQPTFETPTLLNGAKVWNTFIGFGVRINELGAIEFRGSLSNLTSGMLVANLPASYRPVSNRSVISQRENSNPFYIQLGTNGDLTVFGVSPTLSHRHSFDGVVIFK